MQHHSVLVALIFAGLLARWTLLPEARAARPWRAFMLGAVQSAAIWLAFDLPWTGSLSLVACALAFGLILNARERKGAEAPGARLLLLLAHLALIGLASRHFPLSETTRRFAAVAPSPTLAWLTGALLCLKESNFFIRWFFTAIKTSATKPQPNEEQKARAETGNGRVIGSLERLLVYVLLLAGHTFSVPAVIAIKALARFKRMEEDQAFAEYVIIGTFLSILLTLAALGCARSLGL